MKDIKLYEEVPQNETPVRIMMFDKNSNPSFKLHWHEHLEIHYILDGFTVARCENDVVTATKDHCLIINSNELHESMDVKSSYVCIMLPPSFAKNNNIIIKRVIQDPVVSKLINNMVREFTNPDESSSIATTGYAGLLLSHLYRNHAYREINKTKYSAYSQKTILLNRITKYIHDNYTNNLKLSSIAKEFHINQHYFCHIFKEFTGQTLKDYLNHIRIDKARQLLSATNIPISEIAFLCGFNDSNYFSRKFKEITGCTPRSLRQKDEDYQDRS